jgi:hypothetical protein
MTDGSVEGGCLCGLIRYRATGPARARTLCHCRSCRLASGAPSVAWSVFDITDFTFTAQPPARFNSSPPVTRTFCPRCGTPLTYQHESRPDAIDATTATLDHPEEFAPTMEIWVAQKLAWETLNDELPHFAGTSVRAKQLNP